MKNLILFITISLVILFTGCKKDDDASPEGTGVATLKFDNWVGQTDLKLDDEDNDSYTSADGQKFGISTFGYYISNIILEGDDGLKFTDPVSVSATETKGIYHVNESDPASVNIDLKDIPVGKYKKLTFTVGVPEDGVKEGAAAGVLDPAEGAWFWNWNAGYVAMKLEGSAMNSGSADGAYAFHIGGWREVEPAAGETKKFVNNIKTITLNIDDVLTVASAQKPRVHITANAMVLIDNPKTDFSKTFSVHRPSLGTPFANVFDKVFQIDHVHQ